MNRRDMLREGAASAVNLEWPADWTPLLYYIHASRLVMGGIIGYTIGVLTGGFLIWMILEVI